MLKRIVKSKYSWNRFTSVGMRIYFDDISSSELCKYARAAAKRRDWNFRMKKEGNGVWAERIL